MGMVLALRVLALPNFDLEASPDTTFMRAVITREEKNFFESEGESAPIKEALARTDQEAYA